jgi:hypothetical protein
MRATNEQRDLILIQIIICISDDIFFSLSRLALSYIKQPSHCVYVYTHIQRAIYKCWTSTFYREHGRSKESFSQQVANYRSLFRRPL